jgi:hypothetical protein
VCREAYAPIFETLPVNHVRSAVHQTRTCVPTVKSSVGEGDDADDEELEEAELSSESDSSGTARLVTRRGISDNIPLRNFADSWTRSWLILVQDRGITQAVL